MSHNLQLYPLIFDSLLQERVWGSNKLLNFNKHYRNFTKAEGAVFGESWDIVDRPNYQSRIMNGPLKGLTIANLREKYKESFLGEQHDYLKEFPVLVKIIDAKEDLSIQVHPHQEYAEKYNQQSKELIQPKSEFWYVLESLNNSAIYKGFNLPSFSKEQFIKAVEKGEIPKILNVFPSMEYNFHYIKSGTIHGIGKGNLILELQENSDTTFRIYDWNRDYNNSHRQLHLKEAIATLNYAENSPSDSQFLDFKIDLIPTLNPFLILRNKLFSVECAIVKHSLDIILSKSSFKILSVIQGDIRIDYNDYQLQVSKGMSCLLPADISVKINNLSNLQNACCLITQYMPQ